MPVDLTFEPPALFFMRAFGVVTVDEVRLAVADLLSDSRLVDGVAIFIDNRQVTSVRTVAEVAVITGEFAKIFSRVKMKVAILTDRELEASQVFASFASTVGADARVFKSEQDARAWVTG